MLGRGLWRPPMVPTESDLRASRLRSSANCWSSGMNGARQVQVGRQETHAQRSPTVIEGCGALGLGVEFGAT